MELDDFKIRNSKSKGSETGDNLNIDAVVDALRKSEIRQKIKTFAGIIFLITLSVLYFALQRKSTPNGQLGFVFCGIGFLLGAIYLYFRYRPIPPKFYNLGVDVVLRKSQERLKYLTNTDYLILIPILIIIGTGGGLILTGRLLRYTDNLALIIVIWIIFFISLCIFGFFAGKRSWEKEHGKLYREIDELLKNL